MTCSTSEGCTLYGFYGIDNKLKLKLKSVHSSAFCLYSQSLGYYDVSVLDHSTLMQSFCAVG
jgi:hypothetical protein